MGTHILRLQSFAAVSHKEETKSRNMKSPSIALAFIATACRLAGVVAPSPSGYDKNVFHTTEAVVMEKGDVWPERQSKRFHNKRCEVRLQSDGNFVVKRILAANPWYQQLEVSWVTGGARTTTGTYHAQLEDDGSLVVIHKAANGDDSHVYTSNIGDPRALDNYTVERVHKVVISEECVLSIPWR